MCHLHDAVKLGAAHCQLQHVGVMLLHHGDAVRVAPEPRAVSLLPLVQHRLRHLAAAQLAQHRRRQLLELLLVAQLHTHTHTYNDGRGRTNE